MVNSVNRKFTEHILTVWHSEKITNHLGQSYPKLNKFSIPEKSRNLGAYSYSWDSCLLRRWQQKAISVWSEGSGLDMRSASGEKSKFNPVNWNFVGVSPAQLTVGARILLRPRSDPPLLYEPSFERSRGQGPRCETLFFHQVERWHETRAEVSPLCRHTVASRDRPGTALKKWSVIGSTKVSGSVFSTSWCLLQNKSHGARQIGSL